MVLAMRLHVLAILMVCICFALANPRVYRRQDNSDAPAITASSPRTRATQSSSTATMRPSESEGSISKGGDSETLSSFLATGRTSISTSTSTPRPTSSASRTEEVISAITSNANGPVQTNYNRNGNYSCKLQEIARDILANLLQLQLLLIPYLWNPR